MNMNKVILIGRISNDVRFFQSPSGVPYVRGVIAINRRNSNNSDITDYLPFIAWRSTAEYVNSYLQKGDLVSVEGSLQSSQYQDKNGQTVRSLDVVVDSIMSLETREVREMRRNKNSSYSQNNSYNNNFKQPLKSNNLPPKMASETEDWNQTSDSEFISGFRLPPITGDDIDD
ncbi:single-stranded DNA-binding protein [Mycoplasmopsis columbina SF7]|uniref:Single-stranded DNA-binding protein n=2 Tax=Mycoplasmopsis columbina TaxID=114881 RepID=F9UKF3_9BACT|nr:single-stranded DNA-binding protein [Mycoplasmopsis columbina SF7]VEU77051.1 single strand binding protein [Mycoplasmopsis columbina]